MSVECKFSTHVSVLLLLAEHQAYFCHLVPTLKLLEDHSEDKSRIKTMYITFIKCNNYKHFRIL